MLASALCKKTVSTKNEGRSDVECQRGFDQERNYAKLASFEGRSIVKPDGQCRPVQIALILALEFRPICSCWPKVIADGTSGRAGMYGSAPTRATPTRDGVCHWCNPMRLLERSRISVSNLSLCRHALMSGLWILQWAAQRRKRLIRRSPFAVASQSAWRSAGDASRPPGQSFV